jgi:DNA-binding NarL/FixJ family response regulator
MQKDDDPPEDGGQPAHRPAALSRREEEVVSLIARGLETPAIAKKLHISEHTVRAHVRRAMDRLGARTRAHLVAIMLSGDPDASYLWWPSNDE